VRSRWCKLYFGYLRCPHCASSLNNNVRAVLTFYLAGDFSPNLSKALSARSLRFIGSRSEYLVLISMSSYIPPLSSSRYVRMKLSNQGLCEQARVMHSLWVLDKSGMRKILSIKLYVRAGVLWVSIEITSCLGSLKLLDPVWIFESTCPIFLGIKEAATLCARSHRVICVLYRENCQCATLFIAANLSNVAASFRFFVVISVHGDVNFVIVAFVALL